jgi:hypothetical protein
MDNASKLSVQYAERGVLRVAVVAIADGINHYYYVDVFIARDSAGEGIEATQLIR